MKSTVNLIGWVGASEDDLRVGFTARSRTDLLRIDLDSLSFIKVDIFLFLLLWSLCMS